MTKGGLQAQIGQRLKQFREAEHLSQEAFANRLGLHRTYMGALERGERNISLQVLERLAKELEVDPEWFFTPSNDHH